MLKTLSISLADGPAAAIQPLSRSARVAGGATQPLCQSGWSSHSATQPLRQSGRSSHSATQSLCQSGWSSHSAIQSPRVAEWLSGWGGNFHHCAFNLCPATRAPAGFQCRALWTHLSGGKLAMYNPNFQYDSTQRCDHNFT